MTFFPSQFTPNGDLLTAWVPYKAVDWSTYTITAVRNSTSTTLVKGTSGVGGNLGSVDLTLAEYAFFPLALQGLQGAKKPASTLFRDIGIGLFVLFILFVIYKLYKMFR